MTIVKSAEPFQMPPPALLQAIGKLADEATKAGVFVETAGLAPTAAGTRVRLSKGKISVTDGPFTEAKEVVGGYAIFDVGSKEEVLEWTRRFMELHRQHWPNWEGVTEVREMVISGPPPHTQ
jgi:hypothetical protein